MRTPSAKGFTIVELLVVIVVIGILAGIVVVSYSNVQRNARNVTRISAARTLKDAIEIADTIDAPTGLDMSKSYYCLSDQEPEKNDDGTPKCGERPGDYPAEYSESLIKTLKAVTPKLPYAEKVDEWGPAHVYYGPTLIVSNTWSYADGDDTPITAVLEYWLEGKDQECQLPTVYIDDEGVPAGSPVDVYKQGEGDYNSDSKVTYCYVPLDFDASNWWE